MNDKTKFLLCRPIWSDSDDVRYYVAYSNNEFIMKQFMNTTLPLIYSIYHAKYEVELLEYYANTEDEFHNIVKRELDIDININDCLDVYESENNPNLAMYLTPNYLEGELCFDDMAKEFVHLLWTDQRAISRLGSNDITLPEKLVKMLELINNKYLLLIMSLYVSDVYAFKDTPYGKSVLHLLGTQWKGDNPETFAIYDILDHTLMQYAYIANDLSFAGTDGIEGV